MVDLLAAWLHAVVCCCLSSRAVRFSLRRGIRQPNSEYQARRAKLRSTIKGPVVLFGYTSRQDAGELAVFFQEENFYYLTGHSEPDAALLLIPDSADANPATGPHEILYLPPRNPAAEKWGGPKMGPGDPGIAEETGFQAVEPFANLRADLVNLAKTYSTFYTELPTKGEKGYPHLTTWSEWVQHSLMQTTIEDISPALASLRQIKSAGEIALIQKAVDASVDAHIAAMKMMRPGLFEYQIAARMKEVHEMEGCSREAYAPIVGTGLYSTVLHYDALKNEIKDGDVVVIDVACEYGGYAADITRTLPANGKFTARQREIYEIVLGAQNAALAAIKPGAMLYGTQERPSGRLRLHQHARPRPARQHARPLLLPRRGTSLGLRRPRRERSQPASARNGNHRRARHLHPRREYRSAHRGRRPGHPGRQPAPFRQAPALRPTKSREIMAEARAQQSQPQPQP